MSSRTLLLLAALVALAGANVLPRSCPCNRAFEPTCGTDGITYPNECMLQCAAEVGTSTRGTNLKVAHSGRCAGQLAAASPAAAASSLSLASAIKPVHLLCLCRQEAKPVCGNDGVTYANKCALGCAAGRRESTKGAGLKMVHEGNCVSQVASSSDLELTVLAAKPAHLLCMCRFEAKPVCGNDGVTYANICSLRCANGRRQSIKGAALEMVHEGKCGSKSASNSLVSVQAAKPAHLLCMCRFEAKPVCGNDGLTYANICSLRCANGRRESTKGAGLKMVHEGKCGSQKASSSLEVAVQDAKPAKHLLCMCMRVFKPVCGTDGVTYSNVCALHCAAGRETSSKGAGLQMAREGAC